MAESTPSLNRDDLGREIDSQMLGKGRGLVTNARHKWKSGPAAGRSSDWLRAVDLNHRPLGYEPNELPDCSTPQSHNNNALGHRQTGQDLLLAISSREFASHD